MIAKYVLPILIFTTVLFWLLTIFIPIQAGLFTLLQYISLGILLFYLGILLGSGMTYATQYKGIDCPGLIRERFTTTLSDNVVLHGQILSTSKMDHTTPVVLACHGWFGNIEWRNDLTYPLVIQGYKVVTYNHRGHGLRPYKSGGNKAELQKTVMDVQQVVDFIESRPDLNHEKLAAIGFSLGGTTLLIGGYLDDRIKLIMAFCTSHESLKTNRSWARVIRFLFRLSGLNINPSEALNRQISPKYFLDQRKENKVVCLAHTKNDRVVPYDAFLQNKELLELPEEQTIVFERGDHAFTGQNTVLLSQVIKWLKTYL